MDVFPTMSALAGLPLPRDRAYDGRDMSEVLLRRGGKSHHEFLFFYGGCAAVGEPAAVRHGKWKAHWCTGPGLGGSAALTRSYNPPLLFNVEEDPSEAEPLNADGKEPGDPDSAAALR